LAKSSIEHAFYAFGKASYSTWTPKRAIHRSGTQTLPIRATKTPDSRSKQVSWGLRAASPGLPVEAAPLSVGVWMSAPAEDAIVAQRLYKVLHAAL
jgi:hypothetical protein